MDVALAGLAVLAQAVMVASAPELLSPSAYGATFTYPRWVRRTRLRIVASPLVVSKIWPSRGPSASQPSFPAYASALISSWPSKPISQAFLLIHAFAIGGPEPQVHLTLPSRQNSNSSRRAFRWDFHRTHHNQH